MEDVARTVLNTVSAYFEGSLPLAEAAARLAALPQSQFRDSGPNVERGTPRADIEKLEALYRAVRALRVADRRTDA